MLLSTVNSELQNVEKNALFLKMTGIVLRKLGKEEHNE